MTPRAVARRHETVRLLMTAPGVRPITAMAVVAAFDDASRFRRSSSAGAYLRADAQTLRVWRDQPEWAVPFLIAQAQSVLNAGFNQLRQGEKSKGQHAAKSAASPCRQDSDCPCRQSHRCPPRQGLPACIRLMRHPSPRRREAHLLTMPRHWLWKTQHEVLVRQASGSPCCRPVFATLLRYRLPNRTGHTRPSDLKPNVSLNAFTHVTPGRRDRIG